MIDFLDNVPPVHGYVFPVNLTMGLKDLKYEDYGHLGPTKHDADHALVIMIWGFVNHWKEPMAYYLSKRAITPNILQFKRYLECTLFQYTFEII